MRPRAGDIALFVGPWIVGFTVLTLLPIGLSLRTSLHSVDRTIDRADAATVSSGDPGWSAAHYRRALGYVGSDAPLVARFRRSIANTLIFAVLSVPLLVFGGLALALLLNQGGVMARCVRVIVYLPHLLGGAATALIAAWFFNPQFGFVNAITRPISAGLARAASFIGIPLPRDFLVSDWFFSPSACRYALALVSLWSVGNVVLVYLAGLARVPRSLGHAAYIDGATGLAAFRVVTWPHIAPVVLLNLVISVLFSMQAFTSPFLLSNRSQGGALELYVPYLYSSAFVRGGDAGLANATAWLFTALLMVLVVVVVTSRLWVPAAPRREQTR